MKIISSFLVAILLLGGMTADAQKSTTKGKGKTETTETESDDGNLVPNSGFEDVNIKTLKSYGQLQELCMPWLTPNVTSADLFATGVKGTKAGAPQNDYGVQEPMTGIAYAGFRAYTKDPKKSRTYLQIKLNKKLEKDKTYCVRFNLSLADLSKYGVNNVGVFISDRKIQNNNDNALTYQPQIKEKTNKVIKTMDGWEAICGTYIAKGTEEYIIIGGFGNDDVMKAEKVKKPSNVTGTAINDAYYYIDNVEIVEVEAASQCTCGKAEASGPAEIYSKATAKNPNAKPVDQINGTAVYFAFLDANVPSQFEEDLNAVLGLLKADPNLRIELIGHSETEEVKEAKINTRLSNLATRRAEAVKRFFVDAGISESRITISSKEDTAPANTKGTDQSRAQNRRVEFVVR